MNEKLIGTINEDNSIEWPKTDVLGGGFSVPATRHALSPTTFVVLPAGFNQWELLEEMKGRGKNVTREWPIDAAEAALAATIPEDYSDTVYPNLEADKPKKGKA